LPRVPSVLVPGQNTQLNPLHPVARDLVVAEILHWPFDPRLARAAEK